MEYSIILDENSLKSKKIRNSACYRKMKTFGIEIFLSTQGGLRIRRGEEKRVGNQFENNGKSIRNTNYTWRREHRRKECALCAYALHMTEKV